VNVTVKHNHDPDFKREGVLKCNVGIKKLAAISNNAPRVIINSSHNSLNSYEAAKCASDDALRQTINRVRGDKIGHAKNPKSLNEFEMTEELSRTLRGVRFYYDSTGKNSKYEIIMYATDDNIKELVKADEWYGDGTFEVSPKLFAQLYTIHALVRSKRGFLILFYFKFFKLLLLFLREIYPLPISFYRIRKNPPMSQCLKCLRKLYQRLPSISLVTLNWQPSYLPYKYSKVSQYKVAFFTSLKVCGEI
jgi:hypothetical protein